MRQFIATLLLSFAAGSIAAAPFAYSINSNGIDATSSDSLFRIDLITGKATRINKVRPNEVNINSDIEGLAFDKNGVLYGVDDADETLLRIDTATGLGTSVSGNPFNLALLSGKNYDFGLTFTCKGALLMASDSTQTLYSLDENLGTATLIGNGALNIPITALAAWGDKVYGLGQGSSNNQKVTPNLYLIDIDSGQTTLIGQLGKAAKLYANGGMAFDENGILWAVTDRFNINNQDFPSQLLQINTQTGKATAVADTNAVGFESLAIGPPGGCDANPQQPLDRQTPSIPVLGPISLAIMILVLSLVGCLNLRRQYH